MDYTHGGDIYGEKRIAIDFSVNTNPLGMPESVRRAVEESSESWAVYPDSRCRALRGRLSVLYSEKFFAGGLGEQTLSFEPENFLCGNGAADLLFSLVFALKPRKALLLAPGFGEYEAALIAAGCEVRRVCLKEENDFSMELGAEELGRIFTEDLDMVILGNPNNPTGTAISLSSLRLWADICSQRNIYLVVDECFNWFMHNSRAYSAVPLLGEYPCVLVLNAFTKIFAMAGLRLGYLISKNREVLNQIEMCRQPWSVSAPATAAGLSALDEEEFQEKTRVLVAAERDFLRSGLKRLGFKVYPSQVNFLLFQGVDGVDYYRLCLEQGILIRSCKNFHGLSDAYYRVAVRGRSDNEALLSVLHNRITD